MICAYPEHCVIVICVLIKTVLCANTVMEDHVCYCLVEEISELRNPVHLEATVLDGEDVYFIAEQPGLIHEYRPNVNGNRLRAYVDISSRVVCHPELFEERGLLGFTLHPKFATNKKLYTYSVRSINSKDHVVISEIIDKNVANERLLMAIEQPGTRRNGGQLLFGDDGYLYIFVGDGGPTEDKYSQAQNGSSFLGKVLRIDVDKTTIVDNWYRYYDIPSDNPKRGWRPEVYAVGLRNMWRCSIDSGDEHGNGKGRIFCGDIGSALAEELIELKNEGNYGWPYLEGTLCQNDTLCQHIASETVSPIYEFRRGKDSNMSAIVGGPLYRGALFPEIYGQLVYGDFSVGSTFTLKHNVSLDNPPTSPWTPRPFPRCDKSLCCCDAQAIQRTMLLAFGQTRKGELLLLMTDDPTPSNPRGAVLRLVPSKNNQVTCGVTCGVSSSFPNLLAVGITLTLSVHYFRSS